MHRLRLLSLPLLGQVSIRIVRISWDYILLLAPEGLNIGSVLISVVTQNRLDWIPVVARPHCILGPDPVYPAVLDSRCSCPDRDCALSNSFVLVAYRLDAYSMLVVPSFRLYRILGLHGSRIACGILLGRFG